MNMNKEPVGGWMRLRRPAFIGETLTGEDEALIRAVELVRLHQSDRMTSAPILNQSPSDHVGDAVRRSADRPNQPSALEAFHLADWGNALIIVSSSL